MPRLTKAQQRPDTTPSFLSVAKAFYGPAFSPRRKSELAEAMADWAELTPDEQSFAMAHLQYLNLVAEAGTQQLLADVAELLEELVENVDDALDELPSVDAPVDEEPGADTLPLPDDDGGPVVDAFPDAADLVELDPEGPGDEEVPDASE